jgi:hypothetical protein
MAHKFGLVKAVCKSSTWSGVSRNNGATQHLGSLRIARRSRLCSCYGSLLLRQCVLQEQLCCGVMKARLILCALMLVATGERHHAAIDRLLGRWPVHALLLL